MSSPSIRFRPPSCKSAFQRALYLAFVVGGRTRLLFAETEELSQDIRATLGVLRALGARVEVEPASMLIESAAWPQGDAQLQVDVVESATSGRIFTAIASFLGGAQFEIDAAPSLRRRPLGQDFIDVACAHGAAFDWGGDAGHFPFRLRAAAAAATTALEVELDATLSSQSASGALIACAVRGGSVLVRGPLSYLPLTLSWVEAFGARFTIEEGQGATRFTCTKALPRAGAADAPASSLEERVFEIPGDPSAACFFDAWARGHGVGAEIVGLQADGVGARHPDLAFAGVCEQALAGMPAGAELELAQHPDCVAPLTAYLSTLDASFALRAAKLRFKESDRLAVLADGLIALGFEARTEGDALVFRGREPVQGAGTLPEAMPVLATHGDHRMAMCFGILGSLHGLPVQVDDRACVAKSFPDFWAELARWDAERCASG